MFFLPDDYDILKKLVRDGGYPPLELIKELAAQYVEYASDLSDLDQKEKARQFSQAANVLWEAINDYDLYELDKE